MPKPEPKKFVAELEEHSSLLEEVMTASQAIESLRTEQASKFGLDPLAVELLP